MLNRFLTALMAAVFALSFSVAFAQEGEGNGDGLDWLSEDEDVEEAIEDLEAGTEESPAEAEMVVEEPAAPEEEMMEPEPEAEGSTLASTEPEPAPEPEPEPSAPAEAAAAEAAEEETGPRLDEIIVTAQKRAEDVQDVPLSVSAIGGETLKERNIGDLATASDYTPNMTVTNTPTFNFIQMRGLASGWNRGFEQSVAIVIDDVFYGRPSYLSNGQLDLSAVEVLRGPQGTLFGKNAVAGVLHLRTRKPDGNWEADFDGTYGSFNFQRYRGAFGGPLLNDDWSFRIAFMSETQDGTIFNRTIGVDENQLDNKNIRVKIGWEATANLNMDISLNGGTLEQNGSGAQPLISTPRNTAAMQVFDPSYEGSYDDVTHKDFRDSIDRQFWDVTFNAEYDWGDVTINNVTNIAWFDEDLFLDPDYAPMPALKLDNNEDFRQYSQELRITSAPGEWEYVAGVYLYGTDIYATYDYSTYITVDEALLVTGAGELALCDPQLPEAAFFQCRRAVLDNAVAGELGGRQVATRQAITGVVPIESSNRVFDQQTNSYAGFLQVDWNITESWGLTVGARMSYEEKTLHIEHHLVNDLTGQEGHTFLEDPETGTYSIGSNPLGSTTLQFFTPGIQEFEADRTREEFDISPKLSLQYRPTDDLMAYLTYGRGFKSGGFNAQPNRPNNIEFEEEISDTYEAGFKSDWLGGAGRLNVSLFYTQFQGLQISAFNGVEFVVDNAADATIYGVEWESMLVPMEGLFLQASGAWTIPTYDTFTGGPCKVDHYGTLPCDLSGENLPGAPEWQHTLSATWDRELFNWGVNLHMGVDGLYKSEYFITTDQDPNSYQEEIWNVRARIGFRHPDGNWVLMLNGSNLTNNRRAIIFNDTPAQFESHFGILEPERQYQLVGRFQF